MYNKSIENYLKFKYIENNRDAKTGRLVTADEVKNRPNETTTEQNPLLKMFARKMIILLKEKDNEIQKLKIANKNLKIDNLRLLRLLKK